MCDLFLVFPISGIDLLGEDAKTVQSAQLTDVAYLVLDSVGETCIEVVTQGAITVALNLGRDTVEVNYVSIGTMVFLHVEVVLQPCPTLGPIRSLRSHRSFATQLRLLTTYSGRACMDNLQISTTLGLYSIHSLPHLTICPALT